MIPLLKAYFIIEIPSSSETGELYTPVRPIHPNPNFETYDKKKRLELQRNEQQKVNKKWIGMKIE